MDHDPKLINGKKLARKREEDLRERVKKLRRTPKVVSLLIGDDPPSILYTQMKQKKAEEVGIDFEPWYIEETKTYDEVVDLIRSLNVDPVVDGIMVQLPIPKKFLGTHKTRDLLQIINVRKDIDGLTPYSPFYTAAVVAVMTIIEEERIKVTGKRCVVVGASELIGKPIAYELEKLGGEVKVLDKHTKDLKLETGEADILVSATGVVDLIKGDMVKEGVVIIDVGVMVIEEEEDGKKEKTVKGDVEFESVAPKASKITPVPGGVGPLTVISLMENVAKAAEYSNQENKRILADIQKDLL